MMIPGEIIESKSADAVLNESELKYRRLFETAQDAILILDGDTGEILDANKFIIDMLGYPLDYFIGRHLWELGFIKDKSLAQDAFLKLKSEGYIRYEDLPLETKDGQRMNVEFVSNVYLVGNKKIIQCNIRDITERKHAYESLQHLANIVEFSDDAIIGKNLDGIIVSWNAGAKKMYGYRASEVIGKPVSILIPPGENDELPKILNKIQNGEIISHFETKRVTKDGKIIDVSLTISPIKNNERRIVGASTIVRDITDAKIAERALREREEWYRTILQTTTDGFWIIDLSDGRFIEVNETYCNMVGYTSSELLKLKIPDIDAMFTPAEQAAQIKSVIEHGSAIFETRHRRKDGSIFDVELSVTYFDRGGGKLICFCRDITKRKLMEETLVRSEGLYRNLAEESPDQIFIDGRNDTIQYVNSAALKLFQRTADQVIGKSRKDFFPPQIAERQELSLKLVFKMGQPVRKEEIIQFGKKELWIDTNLMPLKDKAGNVTSVLGISRDITERKRKEEALRLQNQISDTILEGVNIIRARDGVIVFVNAKFEEMFGYEKGELLGKHISAINAPEEKMNPGDTAELITKILHEKGKWRGEIKNIKKDGTTFWCLAVVSAFEHPEFGSAWISAHIDITDRKLAEEALQESEKRYRDLFESTNVVMFVVNPDTGRIVDVNSAASRYYGYSKEEFSRLLITDINIADPKMTYRAMAHAVINAGEVFSFRHQKKNGEIRDVEVFSTPIIRNGRSLLHSIVQDVTERKQAEELLRQNQQLLASAMDLAKMVSWEYDVATNMFTFDNHFFAFYGTTAEREGGHLISAEAYVREFVYPEDIPAVAEEIKKVLTITDPTYRAQIEHRIVRRDGTIRTIIVQLAPVFGADGKIKKTFGANQDITEHKKAEEVLQESEARYRNLFTNMLEGYAYCLMLYDDAGQPSDFIYLNVNSAFDQIIGTKTVTGKRVTEVFPGIKAAFPELFEIYGRVVTTGQPASFDLDFKPSGKWLHISAYSPAKDHFVAVFEDITARRLADDNLKKAEKKYRDIFETALDGIYQITPKGRFLDANPAMARILGYNSVDDLIATVTDTARQLWVHQEQRKAYLRQLRDHDSVQDFECEFYRKDKTQIWVSLTTHTVRGPGGKILISEGILVDITRRKNTECELVDRESDYRTILHTTMDGFGLISLDGRFLDVNDALCRLTGYSREELLTLTIADIDAKETAEGFIQHSREIIRKGEDRFETQYRRKNGSLFDVEISVVATDRHGGQFITFLHDITERKRDQEALVSSRNELEQKVLVRTEELNKTNESLVAEIALRNKAENEIVTSLREKEMLLKEIHHRVKNNMQVISSLLFMQAKAQKDETIKEILKESQDRIKSIALVHEKLYQSTDLQRIDYTDYLRKITDHLFESYNVDPNLITLNLNAEKAVLHIDKAVPCSLIINEMISNSLKHAFPGGRKGTITIDFKKGVDNYILNYSDDGIGIPEGITFERKESLGMQLIKGLTKQIDGSIVLDRTAGTKYTITFPV